ncbi:malonyl-CoA decarboxylase, mitochondrial-like [Ischnura elegans]|uniref:malonyl-CoA decarboxylase, mitochondrial-like n=1 Tax=Ischnura elegans TaxID=197161 RepID=UPI001ED8BDA7|nr:malonyl-CoA decarboxylase, mitochondrial-like [Ischnura elegans]
MENVEGRRSLLEMERQLSRITTISEDPEDGEEGEEEAENEVVDDENVEMEEEIVEPCSTVEDEVRVETFLREAMSFKRANVSNWVVEVKIKDLVKDYKRLLLDHKRMFIKVLARNYSVDHEEVLNYANAYIQSKDKNEKQLLKCEDELKTALTPNYNWLFQHVGRLDKGVKFLVDLRTDTLELLADSDPNDAEHPYLVQLNQNLRDMLSLWFSVGFLSLERVTWASSCDMLQKISDYEAVHPMHNWTELKRRVGPNRRCFVYTHGSMPEEPIVVLHTALTDDIPSSLRTLVTPAPTSRMSVDASAGMRVQPQAENLAQTKAAIFYSITSTQKGLQGIELGTYLIKRVVKELQAEFPHMKKFSSLSPIPRFHPWLMDKMKGLTNEEETDLFTSDEMTTLKKLLKTEDLGEFWTNFRLLLGSNTWAQDHKFVMVLETPLMRLCTRYLYLEKRRGAALDPVANFHLRNGAMMWRLNWKADMTSRGLNNSFGIMVNYRYFLDDAEKHSRMYLEDLTIACSDQIRHLSKLASDLMNKPPQQKS